MRERREASDGGVFVVSVCELGNMECLSRHAGTGMLEQAWWGRHGGEALCAHPRRAWGGWDYESGWRLLRPCDCFVCVIGLV